MNSLLSCRFEDIILKAFFSFEQNETNKMEESENQLVDNLEDSGESGDNMIIVSSSEDNKQQDDDDDDAEIVLDDEDAALGESLGDEVNDAKENDDNVAAESSVVETVDKNPPKPVTKKTKKKDKGEKNG